MRCSAARLHRESPIVPPLVIRSTLLPLAAALGLAAGAAAAQDVSPEASPADAVAFVEIASARTSAWVGEPLEVELRVGVAAELVSGDTSAGGLLQLFQTRLDLPVHVATGTASGVDGAEVEALPSDDPRDATLVLDDAVARARRVDDRIRAGTRFSTWRIALRVLPTAPGRLVLPAPSVRFAWATRFEERFVDGRVALDRREGLVAGAPLAIDVRPLPDEGRPPGFTGAVGRFRVDATVEPREVALGGSVKLTLAIEGDGNHGHFDAPALDRVDGFHVRGSLVEREARRLVATYDLAPRDERVASVPPVGFACFATGDEPGWTVLTTPAFPIRVLPSAPRSDGDDTGAAPDARGAPERAPPPASLAARLVPFALALAAVVAMVLVLARVRGRRATREGTPP